MRCTTIYCKLIFIGKYSAPKIKLKIMRSRKIKIHGVILLYLALVGVISVLCVGYLWISSERAKFIVETSSLRTAYLETQQATLKQQVDQTLAFVRHMQSQTEKRLKEIAKNRVFEAYSIAANIYKQHEHSKTVEEIKEIIKDALRPIRFNKGRGYYFAFDLNGIETLFAVRPDMEGKNMLNVRGGQDEFVVSDMLTIIKNKGEGFYSYTWPKPDRDGYFPKTAFVKFFEPIGWVIGTGEYFDEVEKEIQNECIRWISNIQFGKDGYVFAGQYDGLSLSGPATGKNMNEVEDINGVKIVQELIKAAKSGGGFVHYVLPGFEGRKHAPKISYAKGVNEWKWYIGSGVYVDEIETKIAQKQLDLEQRIKVNIRNIVFVLFSLFVFMALIVKLLAMRIYKNLKLFTDFFNRASSDAVKIEKNALHFTEFVELAESANKMIDDRMQAEEELRKSEERLQLIFNTNPDPVVVYDGNGFPLYLNPAFTKVFDWHLNELQGKRIPFVPRDQEKISKAKINQIYKSGNPVRFETKRLTKHGEIVNVLLSAAIIKDLQGRNNGLVVNLKDITEQKTIEAQLRQSQKMEAIGTLAGGIAHDFNNILSGIFGYAQLITMDLKDPDKVRKNIKQVVKGAQRASDLVQQILTFSRQAEHKKYPLELFLIVKEAIKFLRSSIPATIEIKEKISSRATVLADPTQAHQVVINLCTNAYHAMRDSGGILYVELDEIEIMPHDHPAMNSDKPGNYLKLEVRDTGHGMDKKTLERIFDPYFTTKRLEKGTGLGLAVVDGIVKKHNGFIRTYSEVGRGSTFQVFWPVIEKHDFPSIPEKKKTGLPKGTEQIMLVDDEIDILDTSQAILEKQGYKVTTFNDGLSALQAFTEDPDFFDLIITDMTMPRMAGDELSAQILKLRKDMPVILCTGFSETISEEKAASLGIKGFLLKPIVMEDLCLKIRDILDISKY